MNYSQTESCLAFKAGTCLCGFGGLTYHLYALRTLFHQKYSACRRTRRPFSRINSAILTPRKPACGSKDCRRLNRQMLWSLLLHGVRAGATVTNMANNIKACLLQTELKTVQKHSRALQKQWQNSGAIYDPKIHYLPATYHQEELPADTYQPSYRQAVHRPQQAVQEVRTGRHVGISPQSRKPRCRAATASPRCSICRPAAK